MLPETTNRLTCPDCGQSHSRPEDGRGKRYLCVRCGGTIARQSLFGDNALVAFTLAGLLLLIVSQFLPFVRLSRLGIERSSHFYHSISSLFPFNMSALASWILVCAALAPMLLLALLAYGSLRRHSQSSKRPPRWVRRVVREVEMWSMPEVYTLAILISFSKLGSVVDIEIAPGLICYGLGSVCAIIAWRSYLLQMPPRSDGRPT